MVTLAAHGLRLRYRGGSADQGTLELYDGTASMHGFAQSLQVATHAYLNDEIVSRATALRGAQFLIKPPKSGSVLIDLVALIEQYPATATSAVSISAPVFYDFLKLAYRKACGLFEEEPETPYVRRQLERKEPFFDELAENLEGSLQRGHRPIGNSITGVNLERPRDVLVGFNDDTKDWVNTSDEQPIDQLVTGNVTRFNSITRNGRAYIDQLERIVPFRPDADFPTSTFSLLTWSLHGSNTDLPNKLEFHVRYVQSASGRTKRLLLSDCRRLEE